MANLLGVPQYDPSLDREVRQFNSQLLQNLGAQVRQDITTIQTNRQLQGLAQGLQQVDPQSPEFGKGVISLMTQYPLATKTPIGQAAIGQLGAEHKFWQQEQLQRENLFTPIPGANGAINRRTGEVVNYPTGTRPARPVQVGQGTTGLYDPDTKTAIPVEDLGLPVPPSKDPFALEDLRQKNRRELKELDIASKPPVTSMEVKRLDKALSETMQTLNKKKSEAAYKATLALKYPDSDDPAEIVKKRELIAQARAMQAGVQELENTVKNLSAQIGSATAPRSEAPVVIPGLEEVSVDSTALMPEAIPVQPTLQRFKYMTGQGAVPK